jgi:SecD/SecF fusion protein
MKSFTRRIVLCLALLLIASWIVARAGILYNRGEGGFKLGVDLVGGTILVYEVDTERLQQEMQADKNRKPFDPAEMAAFLKRRIDPADLYNVTIRPVGSTRFEIILPTGGAHQSQLEEKNWQDLLTAVREHPGWKDRLAGADLDVPRGHDRDLIMTVLQHLNWSTLKQKLVEKYPALKDKKEELDKIPTGQTAALTDFVKTATAAPADEVQKFVAENAATVNEEDVRKFVESNYSTGTKKYVTSEEIQRIKDLIAQQGSLEFRIVANKHRDGDAFRVAEETIKKTDKAELDRLARVGLPPPAPVAPEGEKWEFTYSWVELGSDERLNLELANKFGPAGQTWQEAAKAREKGVPFVLTRPAASTDSNVRGSTTLLIYSRKSENLRLTPDERAKRQFDFFVLIRNPVSPDRALTGAYLVNAGVSDLSMKPAVSFMFNARGGQLMGELSSGDNLPDRNKSPNADFTLLAIILDGYVVSAPSLSSTITTNGEIIMERAKPEDLRRLAQILRSGALPATLKQLPVSENTIGPTLGDDTIAKGKFSIGVAFVTILVFMVIYYRFAGFVASVALLANLLFTIAFMVAVNATFTLPGLAGLVLTLGMAVDANVLIYERLREERERGAGLTLALRNGYDRALPTIIDTHLTAIFTAIVLYAVGNDQLKGFGISLCAGLVISLFTSLYMTRLMFDYWQARGWLKKLSMYQGLTNFLHRHYIDFMRVRYIWFTVTVVLTVIGLAVFLIRGERGLNIDFVGGTAYGGQLTEALTIGQLRDLLDKSRQDKLLAVQSVEQRDEAGYLFNVVYPDGSQLIRLSNPAPGDTKAAREAAVKARASVLPDWSVEQTFVSTEPNVGGASRYFTIRSTEKEADLVQVAVNRLLHSPDGQPLLKKITLDDFKVDRNKATLTFSDAASPGYLKLLLNREFEARGIVETQPFELRGEGKGVEGRYKTMAVEVSSPRVDAKVLEDILKQTQQAFASRPQPERLENFDAQLAAETSRRAMYAIFASWGAILLYLWFRFGNWTFGAAAVLCLVHDLCFTLGAIAFCHYVVAFVPPLATFLRLEDFKIDLPAVAALLTLVGYSVSDTIVVFDRIREVRGKNPLLTPQMINDSVNQTLSRTLLASLTVFLVVFVLYFFGGEGVHLFAFVMVIGVIVGTYSSIYIASPLLLMFGEGTPSTPRDRKPVTAPA